MLSEGMLHLNSLSPKLRGREGVHQAVSYCKREQHANRPPITADPLRRHLLFDDFSNQVAEFNNSPSSTHSSAFK